MPVVDGWLTWAERKDGPLYKTNGGVNPASIYIPHSAVGDNVAGWEGRLFGPDRVSVHGWIFKDGSVRQYYPFTAQCWGSGSGYPNNNGIAFENAGGGIGHVGEPLTEGQIQANVRIIQELGIAPRRPVDALDHTATLYEHRECWRFGSSPTACPSGRIPWDEILRRLEEVEEDMVIVTKANTGDPDSFKGYLVRGKDFTHIPDSQTFDSLAMLQLPLYEPDKKAWDFMTIGATIHE